MDKDKILEQAKALLGITDDKQDVRLKILIDECIDRVIGYCRTDGYPAPLVSLLPIMVQRAYIVGGFGRADPALGAVVSVKQGERSVQYEGAAAVSSDWIMDFESRLKPYRKRKGRLPSECI